MFHFAKTCLKGLTVKLNTYVDYVVKRIYRYSMTLESDRAEKEYVQTLSETLSNAFSRNHFFI